MEGDALRLIYEQYRHDLFLYLYGLCQNSTAAEDLVQETFLKAFLSLSAGHPNLKAWLYLVARNLYLNQRQKDTRILPLDDLPWEPGTDQTPLDALLRSERSALLYKALATLEERRREVLLLQYFGGFSQKEIAAVLHLTPEHVRVLAYRGKKELKEKLKEDGYELP